VTERKSPARRQRNLIEAAALTIAPALLLYPVLAFFSAHPGSHGAIYASIFLLVCAAAEATGLIAATRALTGSFDAFEAIAIACLVAGVLALGFIAWALATGYHPN
jgi:hypothetical protein